MYRSHSFFGLQLLTLIFTVNLFAANASHASASLTLHDNSWTLVSIPENSPSGSSPANSFASNELPASSYGSGGTWVMYGYDPANNAYTLLTADTRLEAGAGYWMIQITGDDVVVDLTFNSAPFPVKDSIACPTPSGCVEVTLADNATSLKWGLHGYPQANAQLFGNTRIRTNAGICSEGCSPDQAAAANITNGKLYRYDGSNYQIITSTDLLTPGQGFWWSRPGDNSVASADWLVPNNTELKVAFIADQDIKPSSEAVLQLIANEGVDLLLLQGDFGYLPATAAIWEQQLNRHLGENFPVLSVVGNHENYEWPLYKLLITNRVNRVSDLNCTGDIGEKVVCTFRGLQIVQVAVGVREVEGVLPQDGYPGFINNAFDNSESIWRICSWHKNQRLMQTGNKSNDTGWDVYQACRDQGAIVATGHEHAYSRTHLMSDFKNQTIVHTNSVLEIKPGQTFAFVSGLGGNSVRPQQRSGDWWASSYTSTQNATHGSFFCTFSGLTAECYFKAIDGSVPDRFSLLNQFNSN